MKDFSRWNFKLLQAFVLVAEHGSFIRAAEESFRSPSAVSAQIKELETQLGIALFVRTTRRVSLTPEGAELLDYARKAFAELSIGLTNAQNAARRNSQRIRFACIPAIFNSGLSPALTAFESRYPGVLATGVELVSEPLVAAVKNEEVEFGIGAKIASSECEFELLFRDQVYAVMSKSSASKAKSEITVSDLISHPILLPRPGTLAVTVLEKEALRQRRVLSFRHHFSQVQSVIHMAAAGHGVGILAGLLLKSMDRRSVKILRITEPVINRDVSVVVRRGTNLSQPATTLLNALKKETLQLAEVEL